MAKSAAMMQSLGGGTVGAGVLLASGAVALWFAIFGGFVFFEDADSFFNYAASLLEFRFDPYFRTIGYPLLIVLSGFPWTGSIVPLLALQSTFAALTPWLAIRTFASFDRTAAVVAGVLCLASLTPFFFQNVFYHDGACLFFGFLAISFAADWFARQKLLYLYLSLGSAAFAYLIQPAVMGFIVGCAGAFLIFALPRGRQLMQVGTAFAVVAAIMVAVFVFHDWSLRQSGSQVHSLLGRQLFLNAYLRSGPNGGFDATGSAARALRQKLIDYFGGSASGATKDIIVANFGEQDYQTLFAPYEGQPTRLVEQMFAQPNSIYFNTLFILADEPNGVGDELYLDASLEYLFEHPVIVLGYFWDDFVSLVSGLPWTCRGQQVFPACRIFEPIIFYPAMSSVVVGPDEMPDKAYQFLISRAVPDGALIRSASFLWREVYYTLRLPLLIFMLIGWAAALRQSHPLRWPLTAAVIAYVVNIGIISLLVEPMFRYQVICFAVCTFAAGPGIYLTVSWLARGAIAGATQIRSRHAGT
jgi:hypothetical protein